MQIDYFKPGTQVSAGHLNQMVDVLNAFLSLGGSDFVTVNRLGTGVSLGLNLEMLKQRLGRPYGAIPVKLEKDGGVVGSSSTECTWTYTVKALNGDTLATAKTPQVPRLHYTAYWYAGETRTLPNVATSIYGLACQEGSDYTLLIAYGEVPKDDVCP